MEQDERWLLFSEEKPNEGQSVIFGSNHINDMMGRLCKPMVSTGFYCKGKFVSWMTGDKFTATHWMPMPILRN